MREFLSLQPGHARYRNLIGAAAFAERDTYVSSARAVYNGVRTASPNAEFSALLTALNIRSIMSELASRPAFEAHRYVLLAAAEGSCGSPPEYYPDSMRAAIASELRAFKQSSAATDRLQAAAIAARLSHAHGRYQRGGAAAGLDELRFVVERSLGQTTQQWTLALERNTYDLSAPEGTQTLGQVLFEWVRVTDDELRRLRAYRSFTSDDRYCEHLRQQSVRALEAWYTGHPAAEARANGAQGAISSRADLLDRCASCHSGEVAHLIPFADPDALAKLLEHGSYPHGRLLDEILFRLAPGAGPGSMPRGITMSAAQRRGLEEYFLGLARGGGTHSAL